MVLYLVRDGGKRCVYPVTMLDYPQDPDASASLTIRATRFHWGRRTYIMGIVNVTPDSFSGDGTTDVERALDTAVHHLNCGADIVDIGGESTRPGYTAVAERTEMHRVVPVIRALREGTNAIISIDTTKAEVLRRASLAGADILNCVSPLKADLINA